MRGELRPGLRRRANARRLHPGYVSEAQCGTLARRLHPGYVSEAQCGNGLARRLHPGYERPRKPVASR